MVPELELERAYREHHARVLGLCGRLLGDRVAAEDAAADIFARLPSALRTYDPERQFKSWLLGVASNHCIDRLRRRAREQRIFVDDGHEAAAPDDPLSALVRQEDRERLSAAVDSLPEKYRVPLVLRFEAERSYAEIAAALGVELGQVASLLFRARQRLRQELAR